MYPPPPPLSNDYSTGANASFDECRQGMMWCESNPLWPAQSVAPQVANDIRARNWSYPVGAQLPRGPTINQVGAKVWRCKVDSSCTDTCVQPTLPIYSALNDSPLVTEQSKTIYYEIKILSLGAPKRHMFSRGNDIDAGVAIGFCAPPYPPFRMPGWHRGSLAVHSDDGNRYVNNTDGGVDFVSPLQPGQTAGLGMKFSVPNSPPSYDSPFKALRIAVEVFFTRDGRKEGSWDLHEERDADEFGVRGMEGNNDLFAAFGVFGASEFDIVYDERSWMYQP